jgi:hypothetical protein
LAFWPILGPLPVIIQRPIIILRDIRSNFFLKGLLRPFNIGKEIITYLIYSQVYVLFQKGVQK